MAGTKAKVLLDGKPVEVFVHPDAEQYATMIAMKIVDGKWQPKKVYKRRKVSLRWPVLVSESTGEWFGEALRGKLSDRAGVVRGKLSDRAGVVRRKLSG
jgi:hypothetical protein